MVTSIDLRDSAFDTVRQWWRAWIDRDAEGIAALTDPVYAERNDLGRVRSLSPGRMHELFSCHDGDCVITDWELSDPVTRLFERVVVCSYVFRFSGLRGREQFLYVGRATDVLSMNAGSWTIVSHEGVLHNGRLAR